MLAGCPGWPGSRGPEAGVAGRGASPIQLHQQSELHGAGPSTALHFCSKPVVVCSSLSRSFCPHARSCSGLSRDGMMPRPVRGSWSWSWLLKACSSWAPLEEGSATHSHCARCSVPPLFSWAYSPFPHRRFFCCCCFFLLFFKCLFVRVELARVGVSGYGPLHSPQTWRKLRGSRASCP